jgi:hypothetical protein
MTIDSTECDGLFRFLDSCYELVLRCKWAIVGMVVALDFDIIFADKRSNATLALSVSSAILDKPLKFLTRTVTTRYVFLVNHPCHWANAQELRTQVD